MCECYVRALKMCFLRSFECLCVCVRWRRRVGVVDLVCTSSLSCFSSALLPSLALVPLPHSLPSSSSFFPSSPTHYLFLTRLYPYSSLHIVFTNNSFLSSVFVCLFLTFLVDSSTSHYSFSNILSHSPTWLLFLFPLISMLFSYPSLPFGLVFPTHV